MVGFRGTLPPASKQGTGEARSKSRVVATAICMLSASAEHPTLEGDLKRGVALVPLIILLCHILKCSVIEPASPSISILPYVYETIHAFLLHPSEPGSGITVLTQTRA